jgi:hypothetical protein
LSARRANLYKARAAPPEVIYRPTPKRQAASEANLAKAIAARRSPRGRAARWNALKHGLFSQAGGEETVRRLGESLQEFHAHRRLFARLFAPRNEPETWLVREMADLTWRRLRLFHAQARREARQLENLLASAPAAGAVGAEETQLRAELVLSVLDNAEEALQDAAKLRYQMNSLLEELLEARAL